MHCSSGSLDGPELAVLQNFVLFTQKTKLEQEAHGLSFLETPLGPIGVSLRQVLAWMSWLRHHGLNPGADSQPLTSKTLLNRFSQLRAGLYHLGVQPADASWAWITTDIPRTIKDQLAAWEVVDLKEGRKEASRKHLYIEGADIEAFCLHILRKHLLEENASDQDLLTALLLRVQSGTNLRSGNLLKDVHWRDVTKSCTKAGAGAKTLFTIKVINTKMNKDSGAKSLVEQDRKVVRHLDDRLSHHLAKAWWERHHDGRQGEEYFFPATKQGAWNWSRHMDNEAHNACVRECAHFCGLARTVEELGEFTSTSIRRGNAYTTELQVEKFRQQRNKECAWAPRSKVASKHYCPEQVAVMPGPLFWDIADTDARFWSVFEKALAEKYQKWMCLKCGFPNCKCPACAQSIAKGNAKMKHTCWLSSYGRGPMSVADPITNKRVPPECSEARDKAWHRMDDSIQVRWNGKSYHLEVAMQLSPDLQPEKRAAASAEPRLAKKQRKAKAEAEEKEKEEDDEEEPPQAGEGAGEAAGKGPEEAAAPGDKAKL